MSFRRYQEYKDSGIEWLGVVPNHWEITHCRAIVEERTEKNEAGQVQDYLSLMANVGIIPYDEKGDIGNKKPEDLSKCKLVSKNDLVINSMNYRIGSYGISNYNGVCSPVYIVLRPYFDKVDLRFAFRIFEMRAFQVYAQSFGNGILEHRAAINWDILKVIKIAVPPIKEQRDIATFLDRETVKIDALVAEQESLVSLLMEKRQAVISHAVTKGLNPTVPMKDSGIEWLGEVPEHWGITPLKYLISIVESGTSVNAIDIPAALDEIGVLKVSCVSGGHFLAAENKTVLPEELERVSCPVRENTLIVSRANTPELVGAAGLVRDARDGLYLSDKLWQISFLNVDLEFVHFWTQSLSYRCQVQMACSGASSSMQNLSREQFRNFIFINPPLIEQLSIVDNLNNETTKIDELMTKAKYTITLLMERRNALINAAVTGKIDVRS